MQKMFDAIEHCGYGDEKSSDGYKPGHAACAPAPPRRSRISKSAAAEGSLPQREGPKKPIAGVCQEAGYVDQEYE